MESRGPPRVPGLHTTNSIATYLTNKLNNQSLIPLNFYKLTYKITENHDE